MKRKDFEEKYRRNPKLVSYSLALRIYDTFKTIILFLAISVLLFASFYGWEIFLPLSRFYSLNPMILFLAIVFTVVYFLLAVYIRIADFTRRDSINYFLYNLKESKDSEDKLKRNLGHLKHHINYSDNTGLSESQESVIKSYLDGLDNIDEGRKSKAIEKTAEDFVSEYIEQTTDFEEEGFEEISEELKEFYEKGFATRLLYSSRDFPGMLIKKFRKYNLVGFRFVAFIGFAYLLLVRAYTQAMIALSLFYYADTIFEFFNALKDPLKGLVYLVRSKFGKLSEFIEGRL